MTKRLSNLIKNTIKLRDDLYKHGKSLDLDYEIYHKDLQKAAKTICNGPLWYPVYLLLKNEEPAILRWAKDVTRTEEYPI